MPEEATYPSLSVVTHDAWVKALQPHDNRTVPAELCRNSDTLAEFLKTGGEAMLPLPAHLSRIGSPLQSAKYLYLR